MKYDSNLLEIDKKTLVSDSREHLHMSFNEGYEGLVSICPFQVYTMIKSSQIRGPAQETKIIIHAVFYDHRGWRYAKISTSQSG